MKYYVSIDIGGTAVKYGVLDENGTFAEKDKMETRAQEGGAAILEKAVGIVQQYLDAYRPAGICISTAGMVDREKGEIFYAAPLIPDYAGTNFKNTMEKKFGIPCEVENDVKCAGLAESISGAARGKKYAVCLTIGTGIGGAIILDGKVFHGASGSACEVGYMKMDDSDFQSLGASSILSKKVAQKKQDNSGKWNGYRIFEAARQGDQDCIQAIDELADVLGKGIANICCVLNPEIVVLGGGIMTQEDYLKDRVQKALKKYLVSSIEEHTELAFARHRNDAGMLGAFYNFKQRQCR
ncbi:ROK family protein [Ruminococcus gauvreauii]|uniref:ROK family protein n=1 Tax=Ruminococcus gauvreauii TaxID=438033 RepID=A0ABY5VDV0_9FIRM|nr:ROK family protein [Ruminococcus gauvreauii]UWP58680.1 ROK family protein [Ruminococcus gauvreauii]